MIADFYTLLAKNDGCIFKLVLSYMLGTMLSEYLVCFWQEQTFKTYFCCSKLFLEVLLRMFALGFISIDSTALTRYLFFT